LAALIVSIVHPSIAAYEGLTISVCIAIFLAWSYGILAFIYDINEENDKPIYYSMTLFPVYKYEPGKGVMLHYKPTTAFLTGVIILTFWSFFTAA
jgi:hypothetical protein